MTRWVTLGPLWYTNLKWYISNDVWSIPLLKPSLVSWSRWKWSPTMDWWFINFISIPYTVVIPLESNCWTLSYARLSHQEPHPSGWGFQTAAVLRTNWRHVKDAGDQKKRVPRGCQTQLKKMRKSKIGSIVFILFLQDVKKNVNKSNTKIMFSTSDYHDKDRPFSWTVLISSVHSTLSMGGKSNMIVTQLIILIITISWPNLKNRNSKLLGFITLSNALNKKWKKSPISHGFPNSSRLWWRDCLDGKCGKDGDFLCMIHRWLHGCNTLENSHVEP